MKHTTLLLIALLAPLALKAQTSTQGNAAGHSPTSAQSDQPANIRKLDDDPVFKKLSPEQQAWVRQMSERLDKAIAENDTAAMDQLTKEASDHGKGLDASVPTLIYHYQAASNAPAANAPPAVPARSAAPSPCVVAPKKPGVMARIKEHAERALEKQAAKADAQIGKATKGTVDGGVQDATTTAVNEANQPAPCTPVKGQAQKQ